MTVINTFFGAIIGIWMVSAFGNIITEKWLSFVSLFILFFIIIKFAAFTEEPKDSGGKLPNFIIILILSFWLSMFIQMLVDPKALLVEFLFLPKTWLLSVILIFWAIALTRLRETF